MADVFMSPGKPPSWVPGPFREPVAPAKYQRPLRQPDWRVINVPIVSTLAEIAMRFYQDPGAAWRIFNDNREGMLMPDGTYGSLTSPNDAVSPGTQLWLS